MAKGALVGIPLSHPFEFGGFESRVCSASLSFQSLGIIATSLCVQCFCCWDLDTHASCHVISSQLGVDWQNREKTHTNVGKRSGRVGLSFARLLSTGRAQGAVRHLVVTTLHVLLTEDRRGLQSRQVQPLLTWIGVYQECGFGKRRGEEQRQYCSLVGMGERWGRAGKRGSSFPAWPIEVF